jgi:vacuolar-type H+-ATPase subunit E/Vma4
MSSTQNNTQIEGFKKLIDALFDETKKNAESILNEAIVQSNGIIGESEKYSLKRSEEILSSYTEMAEIEPRKEVSKSEIEARMQLLKLKEAYVEKVFGESRKRLKEFTDSSEYKSLMLDNIASLSKQIQVGELIVNEDDMKRLGEKNLQKAAGLGVAVKALAVGIGGFIIFTKDGKASIDRTIDGILRSEKEKMRGKIAEQLFG